MFCIVIVSTFCVVIADKFVSSLSSISCYLKCTGGSSLPQLRWRKLADGINFFSLVDIDLIRRASAGNNFALARLVGPRIGLPFGGHFDADGMLRWPSWLGEPQWLI